MSMRTHAITRILSSTKSKTNIWSLRILPGSLNLKNSGYSMKRVQNTLRMIFSLLRIKHHSMLPKVKSLIHITASVNMKSSKNWGREASVKCFWLTIGTLDKNAPSKSLRLAQPMTSIQYLYKHKY